MRPLDFIATARDLSGANRKGRPRETNLRRAVSTTYYALFHCLAACCADVIVGGTRANRSHSAWNQAYRALNHGTTRHQCEHRRLIAKFPADIQSFAKLFVDLQLKRHRADYDPDSSFSRKEVIQDVLEAERVIQRFMMVPLRDRRAFVAHVLLPGRQVGR